MNDANEWLDEMGVIIEPRPHAPRPCTPRWASTLATIPLWTAILAAVILREFWLPVVILAAGEVLIWGAIEVIS